MERTTRNWLVAATGLVLVLGLLAALSVFLFLRSGFTQTADGMFGDQHLKTAVALIELHKTRYGQYPGSLADLRFTGQWDAIALGAVSYCANANGTAYYIEVERGWAGRPNLSLPPEFWQGTGFVKEVGPCR